MACFGIMAWVGVYFVLSTILHNPSGPEFKLWKLMTNGVLGFVALFCVLMVGLKSTNDHVDNELQEYGVIADAVAVNKEYNTIPGKRGRVSYIYKLIVSFKDEKGNQRKVKSEVSESQYRMANPGMPLKINYSSRNVDVHEFIFVR